MVGDSFENKLKHIKEAHKYLLVKEDFKVFIEHDLIEEYVLDYLKDYEIIDNNNLRLMYKDLNYTLYLNKEDGAFFYCVKITFGFDKDKYKVLKMPDISKEDVEELRKITSATGQFGEQGSLLAGLLIFVGVLVMIVGLIYAVAGGSLLFFLAAIPTALIFLGLGTIIERLRRIENKIGTPYKK